MSEPSNKSVLTQELQRLKAKKAAVDDRDIKQALQLRIDAVQAELAAIEAKQAAEEMAQLEEVEDTDSLEPATPAQLRQAEELIRQARVEKIRKNNARALALVKEAAEKAPNAPAVLEILGDDYSERRLYKDAKATYGRAMKFSKNNVELERKYALAALRAKGMSSFDPAMMLEGSDPMFLTSANSPAKVGSARILNAFIPGLGHVVLGKTVSGLVLIGITVVWIVWIGLMKNDFNGLVRMIMGKPAQPNLLILVPIFGFIVTWLIGIGSLGVEPGQKVKRHVIRPEPPVNLPFE